MSRPRRHRKRKCLHCGIFFLPDPRTHDHQRHCSEPTCKRASKRRAQQRWLSKTENQDYFRGRQNTARVQQWGQAHPGYWRKEPCLRESALQQDT